MPRLSISLGDFEKCMSPRAIDSVGKYIVSNLHVEHFISYSGTNRLCERFEDKFVKTNFMCNHIQLCIIFQANQFDGIFNFSYIFILLFQSI